MYPDYSFQINFHLYIADVHRLNCCSFLRYFYLRLGYLLLSYIYLDFFVSDVTFAIDMTLTKKFQNSIYSMMSARQQKIGRCKRTISERHYR